MGSTLPTDAPPGFIPGLTKLPRELVHKVLDDLPVIKILQIISHKIQYLDQCITTHIRYRRMFDSQASINSVVDYFILYREIKRATQAPLTLLPGLETYGSSIVGQRSYEWRLRTYLVSRIDLDLTLSPVEQNLLNPWGSGQCPSKPGERDPDQLEQFWKRWNWIKDSKLNLNVEKASHFTKAADLITAYPGNFMLKTPLDPNQGAPRRNVDHIANRFRLTARKVLRDHRILYKYKGYCGQAVDGLILVPYDRYLEMFLDVFRKHPLSGSESNDIYSKLENLSLNTEVKVDTKPGKSIYPDNIAADLQVVLKGITYVYTGSPLRIIPRIDWTARVPVFLINHAKCTGMHLCAVKSREPHDPRELEWLEAFLKVVFWMSENLEKLEKQNE